MGPSSSQGTLPPTKGIDRVFWRRVKRWQVVPFYGPGRLAVCNDRRMVGLPAALLLGGVMASEPDSAAIEELDGVLGWLADFMVTLGPLGVAILVAIETFFPPIPSEIILPLAGFVVSLGYYSVPVMIVAATLGGVLGGWGLYWLGRGFGSERVVAVLTRLPLVKPEEFAQAEDWFRRHGQWAVFFGRMVPIVRSLISLPAGVARMPQLRFLAFTTLGTLIWNTLLISLGFAAGENWEQVSLFISTYSNMIAVVLVLVVVAYVVWRVRRYRTAKPD